MDSTSPRPAIVGSGNVGSALARLFARADIDVALANSRGPDTIRELAASIGPGVHPVSLAEALASDLILLAIPFGSVARFGASLPDWTGKTIVDTTNAHRTPGWEDILQNQTSAQYAAEHLPGAQVVKAFNQLPANTLQAELEPAIGRRVIFIATDFPDAGARVADIVESLGLAAVQLGRTDEGGRLIQAPNALVLHNFIERPLF